MDAQRFTVTAMDGGRDRILIPVPFDPDEVWAAKPRHHYLRWIDATKRSPELRAERIATTVRLLEAGVKDYHDQ